MRDEERPMSDRTPDTSFVPCPPADVRDAASDAPPHRTLVAVRGRRVKSLAIEQQIAIARGRGEMEKPAAGTAAATTQAT